jgi:hypothetical protein
MIHAAGKSTGLTNLTMQRTIRWALMWMLLFSFSHRVLAQKTSVHEEAKSARANVPVPPLEGPGYQSANVGQAFVIGNRRGHDPFRKQTRRRLQNADANGGNSNYMLTVPLLSLPGRGLSVALNLYYNSQLWTNQGQNGSGYFVFNHDADWPAPGWCLGFGKIVQVEPL